MIKEPTKAKEEPKRLERSKFVAARVADIRIRRVPGSFTRTTGRRLHVIGPPQALLF